MRHHAVAAGKCGYEFSNAAHLADLTVHIEEVVQVEVHATQAFGRLCLFFFLLDFDSTLDKADNVAHAEDSARHAVGMEHFK